MQKLQQPRNCCLLFIAIWLSWCLNAALAHATDVIQPILITGMQAPDQPNGVSIDWLSPPVMNRADDFVVYCRLVGPGVTQGEDTALLSVASDGTIESVAFAGQSAPGIPGDVAFISLTDGMGDQPPDYQDVAFNDLGQAFFRAELSGPGINPLNNSGLFFYDGAGNTSLVAWKGSQVPGMAAGVLFGEFSELRINNQADVVFNAELVGIGITDTNDYALFKKFDGLPIETVFAEGDFLGLITPQIVYGGVPNFPLNPVLTDQGDIWYTTSIDGLNPDGTEIDWMTRVVLLRREVLGDLRLIARSGEFVEGSPSGLRGISQCYLLAPNTAVFGSEMGIAGSFSGVFAANGVNPLEVIALDGQETDESGTFYDYLFIWTTPDSNFIFDPTNAVGDVSFAARIFDTSLGEPEDAIFTKVGSENARLRVRASDWGTAFDDDLQFLSLKWPLIDNTGRVLYRITPRNGLDGLMLHSAGEIDRALIRVGQPVEIDIDGNGPTLRNTYALSHPNRFNDSGVLALRIGISGVGLVIARVQVPQFGDCACPGDLNGDGNLGGDDIQGFIACLFDSSGACDCANVNGFDGVSPNDIDSFVDALLTLDNACP